MAVTLSTEISQFLNFRMIVLNIVLHGKILRIVEANIASKSEKDTADLKG